MKSRLALTTEENAPEATRPVLSQLKQALGMVPNVYAAIGNSPGALSSLRAWSDALAKSSLSKREVELISLHVSELNGCGYCVSAHSALGARVGVKPEELAAARTGTGANARENALLALVRRVVRTGGARAGGELARLREAGVSDAEVIDILAVVALNAFRNAVSIVSDLEIDFPKAENLPSP
jgi:uncharacterized peroxidase-related enzyme